MGTIALLAKNDMLFALLWQSDEKLPLNKFNVLFRLMYVNSYLKSETVCITPSGPTKLSFSYS